MVADRRALFWPVARAALALDLWPAFLRGVRRGPVLVSVRRFLIMSSDVLGVHACG